MGIPFNCYKKTLWFKLRRHVETDMARMAIAEGIRSHVMLLLAHGLARGILQYHETFPNPVSLQQMFTE